MKKVIVNNVQAAQAAQAFSGLWSFVSSGEGERVIHRSGSPLTLTSHIESLVFQVHTWRIVNPATRLSMDIFADDFHDEVYGCSILVRLDLEGVKDALVASGHQEFIIPEEEMAELLDRLKYEDNYDEDHLIMLARKVIYDHLRSLYNKGI